MQAAERPSASRLPARLVLRDDCVLLDRPAAKGAN